MIYTKNIIVNQTINNMLEFIRDCAKQLYDFKWLHAVPIDDEILFKIKFRVLYTDNRLLLG